MSATESKVTEIIRYLNDLEVDLDSIGGKVGDMKKQISAKTQAEMDGLLEKTREMAAKEAETLINAAKEKANAESKRISQDGESRLGQIQSSITANFDEAVRHVVSTVLKA